MKYVLYPEGEVYLLKSKAIERPEESLSEKPHLVKDEVSEAAEGEDKEPRFAIAPVEPKPGGGNENEK